MESSAYSPGEAPAWVRGLGAATWIRAPGGRISYLNAHAESLLELSASDCVGQPCHLCLKFRDQNGRAYCRRRCPPRTLARRGAEIGPQLLNRPTPTGNQCLQMLTLPLFDEAEDLSLLHIALQAPSNPRMEGFLRRVAHRSPAAHELALADLTGREREILDRLCLDENLFTIAERLHLSHYTVRNHVQHILAKMGAHSMLEAVARYLLLESSADDSRSDD